MLSMQSRYALSALIYLAKLGSEQPVPTSQIAQDTRIPRKFLESILADLKRRHIITSRMGKLGGHMLARPAAAISFAEVIRATDGPIALLPCASVHFYQRCENCVQEAECGIRGIMIEARDQILTVLENRTIADAVIPGTDILGDYAPTL